MKAIYYNIFGVGHIRPTLPLVSELCRRGVEIIYHSSPSRQDLIESTGAKFKNYGRDDYSANDYNPNKNFVLQNLPAARGLLPFLQDEIEKVRPDFLLYDSMAPWGYILGRIYNIPAFCTVTTLAFTPEEIQMAFSQNHIEIDQVNEDAIAFFKSNFQLNISLEHALGAYGDHNIVFTTKSFNTPLNYSGKDFFFTGPQILPREKLESKYLPAKNQKMIVMSFGTIVLKERPELLHHFIELIKEYKDSTDTKLVLAVGNSQNVELVKDHFPSLSGHIIVEEFIPQQALLKIADIFINHGGMNSINEALYYKVPQIIIPIVNDHFINAAQVEKLSLGVQVLSQRSYSLKTIVESTYVNPIIRKTLLTQGPSLTNGVHKIIQFIENKLYFSNS
ncbi:hypothetical protein DOM21_17375 [Bacteriovorax stolpii]|uniref:nucleotide disphospho-sugar-binding domain-containing protein n=1 Tax=Bacteriovorax stolpii TaxID=960 RepID=UPI00115AE119|nr:glycosyltransferase [Bacteriovorax stolpii]QDK43194.1 hypothetical protein DOM21_17375 [Bacteriovorax stolpii]